MSSAHGYKTEVVEPERDIVLLKLSDIRVPCKKAGLTYTVHAEGKASLISVWHPVVSS